MYNSNQLIGESAEFHHLLDEVSKVAKVNRPVLIIGERGTGKELISERIHYLSPRWEEKLIKINCASLPEELLESELFGHEAGAFTGAIKKHLGRFERAQNGTIFLDEIANTSMRLQEKILRVVEYGEFERVGGSQHFKSNARIVAATNIDLPQAVEEGKFRADLLDRLAFDVLTIPPLRFRPDDIVLLANHFAFEMTSELGGDFFPGYSENIIAILKEHSWPGNVRELRNVVERTIYKSYPFSGSIEKIQLDPFESTYRLVKNISKKNQGQMISSSIKTTEEMPNQLNFKSEVFKFEKELLLKSLNKCKNNKTKTAEFLKLSYNQLRGILRRHQID